MSCEFSFEREFSFESKLLLRDRPLLGSSVLILSGCGKGKTLITCLIKREYYRPGASKPPIPPRFFSSTKAPRVFSRTLGTCRTVQVQYLEKSIEGKQFGSKLNGTDFISSSCITSCKWSIPRLNDWRKLYFGFESIFGWNLNRSDLICSFSLRLLLAPTTAVFPGSMIGKQYFGGAIAGLEAELNGSDPICGALCLSSQPTCY